MPGRSIGAWLRIGAALAVLAALGWSHTAAYRAGAASERRAALERSVDLLRERNATDEKIRSMSDADLCHALGGRMQDGACR